MSERFKTLIACKNLQRNQINSIKFVDKNEIILFENQGVKLEVNLKDETVWLTQKQMAELFNKDRRTITRHIQNIYKDEELEENSVCSFFEHTAEDGKKYNVQYYNLDMIKR